LIKSLYSAASGMLGQQVRQEAVANNIANATTVGYKKSIPALRGFYQIYLDAVGAGLLERGNVPGGGMLMDATANDFSQGSIHRTGQPLDAAIDGPGFFVVQDTSGSSYYTRNGHFALNENGELVAENGHTVQGEGGAITATGSNVMITGDGRVLVDGTESGTLRIVTFQDPRALTRVGDTLFAAPDNAVPELATNVTVVPEALESSNVLLAKEMLDMLVTSRNFEANQRVILSVDRILDRTINDVGRV
jgi:flagellar basal-body rod protein FlgF